MHTNLMSFLCSLKWRVGDWAAAVAMGLSHVIVAHFESKACDHHTAEFGLKKAVLCFTKIAENSRKLG